MIPVHLHPPPWISLYLPSSDGFRRIRLARFSAPPNSTSTSSEFENIWLRTKRYNASGKVVSGTGGVCYLYFPARLSPRQRRALASVGVR